MDKQAYKEMEGLYREYVGRRDTNVTSFYIGLENIFAKYFKQGLANEGDSFLFEVGLGITLECIFYKNYTEVYGDNYLDETKTRGLLLSKEDSYKKEYKVLDGFSSALSFSGMCIGPHFSEQFRNMLLNLKKGEIISFEEGKSYVCKSNSPNNLILNQIFDGNIFNLKQNFFSERKDVVLHTYNDQELQRFYIENRKYRTCTVEADIFLASSARVELKEIESDISAMHSKKMFLGEISLVGRKSVLFLTRSSGIMAEKVLIVKMLPTS